MDTFTETPTTPHQAVAANNLGYQGLSATPETVQQRILDDAVTPGSENGKKSRKRRISECLTVYNFTVIQVMKVSYFSLGSQDVRHGASGVQQPPLRKYGGMRN